MKLTDVFPSKYLRAADLDEDVVVTIKSVVMENVQTEGGTEPKAICHFSEGEKGLLLNKTNFTTISEQHGDETDLWIGKKITLTVMDVQFKDKLVPAIRVKPLRKATGAGSAFPKAAKAQPPETE